MKNVYANQYLFRVQVFLWFARFGDGLEELESDKRSLKSRTSKNEESPVSIKWQCVITKWNCNHAFGQKNIITLDNSSHSPALSIVRLLTLFETQVGEDRKQLPYGMISTIRNASTNIFKAIPTTTYKACFNTWLCTVLIERKIILNKYDVQSVFFTSKQSHCKWAKLCILKQLYILLYERKGAFIHFCFL